MTIASSGPINFQMIEYEFAGRVSPIQASLAADGHGLDAGIPATGQISMSQFRGKSKRMTASYTNNIVAYSIPQNAGGTGEGFFRTAASWYNGLDREGTVRLWGNVTVGGGGYTSEDFYAWTKITGYRVFVDGTVVSNQEPYYGGPATMSWDTTAFVSRNSYVYLSAYAWGDFGSDHVGYGSFYVGATW